MSKIEIKNNVSRLVPEKRLYKLPFPVIALTGGVASGKSSVSKYLEKEGLPLLCADRLVKAIYQKEETLDFLKKNFPSTIEGKEKSCINFKKLREIVFSSKEEKEKIERFIYERLPEQFLDSLKILQEQNAKAKNFLIYDIPLLFERKMEKLFDLCVCVYADKNLQIERLMKRDTISQELAESIIKQQFPLSEKKEKSDYVIENNDKLNNLENEVVKFINTYFSN